ncbi:SAM-dependent methyltransferase [Saccharopolyspora sp. K220]|uniref:SAM-dependent methyltransferase n=1 Tax=Saccharopolyspora soli TaxID=2926618 RepID=UPI001F5939F3|nr:SAM-dependent methyltransferase [Saccharopolyspora soli]MCI2419568.1 SAM-dependent methyltransferase [Saccharopolyspora soli]
MRDLRPLDTAPFTALGRAIINYMNAEPSVPHIDHTVPSVARGYDHWLGGKDNFEVDRQVLAAVEAIVPEARPLAVENRKWLIRVTRFLSLHAGIDQFLDCGCGLPTMQNVHQVAQHNNPEAAVVYVDNDPTVAVHARALLEDNDRTHFCVKDLREPEELLRDPVVTRSLDLDRPIGLIHAGTLHHVSDEHNPHDIMQQYISALAPGSYVAISHFSWPPDSDHHRDMAREIEKTLHEKVQSCWWRSNDQVEGFFDGLELLEPGLVPTVDWWPDGPPLTPTAEITNLIYGAVGVKR